MNRIAALLALWTLASAPAHAAPRKADDDPATAAARRHLESAKIHFKLQEWDAAIVEWKEAYRLKAVPSLLFNIAQASRLAGRPRDSKLYYENYLRDQPDAPNRDEVRTQLAQLEALLAREAAEQPPPPRAEPATPPPHVEEPPAPATAPPAAAPAPAPATLPAPVLSEPPPPATPEPARSTPLVTWGLAGATVLLAVSGGVAYGAARASWSEATSSEHPRAEADRLIGAGDSRYHVSLGLAAGALAAAVGAAVTWAVAP